MRLYIRLKAQVKVYIYSFSSVIHLFSPSLSSWRARSRSVVVSFVYLSILWCMIKFCEICEINGDVGDVTCVPGVRWQLSMRRAIDRNMLVVKHIEVSQHMHSYWNYSSPLFFSFLLCNTVTLLFIMVSWLSVVSWQLFFLYMIFPLSLLRTAYLEVYTFISMSHVATRCNTFPCLISPHAVCT